MNRRRIEQLLGETIREIGILVLVFAPLDAAYAEEATNLGSLVGVMLAAVGLIGAGIILETGE